MNAQTITKAAATCLVCAACVLLAGCNEAQSCHKEQYAAWTQQISDLENESASLSRQQQIHLYAPVVQEALSFVRQHSSERMKHYISKGKLVPGMNQKEVIAALNTIDFRDGVPVTSRTFISAYGKYETWMIGAFAGRAEGAPPRYTLDFNDYILKCIHKPKPYHINTAHGHWADAR